MAAVTNATPLMSLDAVVIDTETTGLDPRKARIVEVAAVRIAGGRILKEDSFRQLVDPGEPIPPQVTAVHGIDAAAIAGAPDFAAVWPQLAAFIGHSVVIGHTLGFDLAVLQRECARADLPFEPPRTLDTQHLAQVAEPRLAGYSLEQLATWLGVELNGRHSALGDADTTARIFLALVPVLREGGIRTFAEAAQACRALTEVLDKQHRAGWITPETGNDGTGGERIFSRIDSYPYRHRIRDVMSSPPQFISSDRLLGEALARMMADRISSLFVQPADEAQDVAGASQVGIITERDLLRALSLRGESALRSDIGQFMSRPLATVPADAFVYRAIGRMSRLKIRHLGVVDEAGQVIGALSARDLLRLRAGEAVALGDEIDEAQDIPALGCAWAKLPHVAASLLAEGVDARQIAQIISRELGALTRQAAVLAERQMRKAGLGEAPCPYAVAVLGSAGRGEALLAMDQDNALVFAHGAPEGPEDRWFERLGIHIADILNEVGVPYCKGGVMAKNALWRGSVETWQARIADWILRSRPDDLLAVDIFFDLCGVHGALPLADAIWRFGFDAARGQVEFAKLLVEAAGQPEQGLGFFGGLRTDQGRIDLKRSGLFALVSSARALAIRHHVVERATPARLGSLRAMKLGSEADIAALIDAQGAFMSLILSQQLADIEAGTPAGNAVEVKRLSKHDRERMKNALQAVAHLDEFTRELLFQG